MVVIQIFSTFQSPDLINPTYIELFAGIGSFFFSLGLLIVYLKQYQLDKVFQKPILKTNRVRAVKWDPNNNQVVDTDNVDTPDSVRDKFEIVLSNIGQGAAQEVQVSLIPVPLDMDSFTAWPHETAAMTADVDRRDILEDPGWLAVRETNIGSNELEVSYLCDAGFKLDAYDDPYTFPDVLTECAKEEVTYIRIKIFVEYKDESGESQEDKEILDYVLDVGNPDSTLSDALGSGATYREFERDPMPFMMREIDRQFDE